DGTGVYFTNLFDAVLLVGSPLDGGASSELFSTGLTEPIGVDPGGIGLDPTSIYWTIGVSTDDPDAGAKAGVYRTNKTAGARELLAAPLPGTGLGPFALTVDADRLYWADQGAIRSMPKNGGPIVDLAMGAASVSELAVDDTHVYWSVQGHNDHDGEV